MVLKKYLAYSASAASISAASLIPHREIYVRQDNNDVVASSDETVVQTVLSQEVVVTIPGATETVTLDGTTELATHSGTTTTFSYSPSGDASTGTNTVVVLSGTTLDFNFAGITSEFTLTEATTAVLSLSAITTRLDLGAEYTDITLDGTETTVTAEDSTIVTLSLASATSQLTVSDTSVTFSVSAGDNGSASESQSVWSVDDSVYSLVVDGTTETFTISDVTTTIPAGKTIDVTLISALEASSLAAPEVNTATCVPTVGSMTPEEKTILSVIFGEDVTSGTTYAEWLVKYMSGLVSEVDSINNFALSDTSLQFTSEFTSIDIPGILGLAAAAPMYSCFLSTLWEHALATGLVRGAAAPVQTALSRRELFAREFATAEENNLLVVLFERHLKDDGTYFNYAQLLSEETNELISEVESVISGSPSNPPPSDPLFSKIEVQQLLSIATRAPVYTSGLSAAIETALASYSQGLSSTTLSSSSLPSSATSSASVPTSSSNSVSTQFASSLPTNAYVSSEYRTTTLPPGASGMVTVETIITPHVIGTSTIYQTSLLTVTVCTEIVCEERSEATVTTLTICDETCASLYSAADRAVKTVTVTSCETNDNNVVSTKYVTETVCDEVCYTLRSSAYVAAGTTTVVVVSNAATTRPVATATQPVSVIQKGTNTYTIAIQTKNGAVAQVAGYWMGLLGLVAFLL